MAYNFVDQIIYHARKSNFERDSFETLEIMKNYNTNYLPDTFIAVCHETHKAYLFSRDNDEDPILGKWREFEGSESALTEEITSVFNVGGVTENEVIEAGTSVEDVIKKILIGEVKPAISFYYGVNATKITDLTQLTEEETTAPTATISVTANNEYVIIAAPTDSVVKITSMGFDYTSSFTKIVTSMYDFFYSELPVTCRDFEYCVKFE